MNDIEVISFLAKLLKSHQGFCTSIEGKTHFWTEILHDTVFYRRQSVENQFLLMFLSMRPLFI